MFRALLELIVTIIIAMAARAILGSVMKGFSSAARGGFQQQTPQQTPPAPKPPSGPVAGEMHKDPVCGMYVSEATQYQRRSGRETFYYCSDQCRQQHAVAAKA